MSNTIPEEWSFEKVGKFIHEFSQKCSVENEHEVLTSSKSGLMRQVDYYGENRITRRSTIGFNIIPQKYITYRSRSDNNQFTFNQNTLGFTGLISKYYPVFTHKAGEVYNKFLLHLLNFYSDTFSLESVGTSQLVLSINAVKSVRLPFPPLPEQQKIAAILSSVDDVIEKTREQIDKLKDLKTGMMQELLTKGVGHSEFKDSQAGRIPASWGASALNDLVSIKHGYAFEGEHFRSNPTPYLLLTPGNFNKDGRLYFGPKTKYYDGPVPDEFILDNGDVLVVMTDLTREMAILGNTIILKSPRTVLHNQRIGKVTILREKDLSPEYLCFVMNSDRVKGHIKDTATGTTVRHTSPTKILEPLIPVPPIEEQKKIMSIFQTLDDRLTVVESKLASYEKIKKALMQDLLTGKVRVKVDDKEKESAVA